MAESEECNAWNMMSERTLVERFPLHRACRDGDATALTHLLHEYKDTAKVHLCLEDTYYGWTPSHWAAYFGKLDCLRVLVISGSGGENSTTDIRTSRFNQTPSHIAAFRGHPHCLQWLLQAGADPNAKDYLGETPLHKTARSGSTECAALLASNRAHTGLKNNSNQTAGELARSCSHFVTADYLSGLPPNQGENLLISSNGYYGFHQPTNGQNIAIGKVNAEASDMDMDMDLGTTVQIPNGHTSPNGLVASNGFGHSHSNGSALVSDSAVDVSSANGMKEDMTRLEASQDRILFAGKKRPREDAFSSSQMKRICIEGRDQISATSLSAVVPTRTVNNNSTVGRVSFCPIDACSVRDHYESVVVERGYDALKFQMMLADAHGC